MSEDIKSFLSSDELNINGVAIRKPTAGTLALCDLAKLSMTSGKQSEVPFFEALAFFYIHAHNIKDVRVKLFDLKEGKSEEGRSHAFECAVIDWADNVDLGSVSDMGERITDLLTEAMSAQVEPVDDKISESEVQDLVAEKKM